MNTFLGIVNDSNLEYNARFLDIKIENNSYKVILNGNIYNKNELKSKLNDIGIVLHTNSQEEILLKTFLNFGVDIFKIFNGAFSLAIWDDKKKELYIARDQFGIKPMYYTTKNNKFIFGTDLNNFFEIPEVDKTLGETGLQEIFGIGPAHTQGITLFKNIYELKPGNFIIFNKSGIHIEEYWKLKSREHNENLKTTSEHIKFLLEDSIKNQIDNNKTMGSMLSGGIDSSIVTTIASKYYMPKRLKTFSVDYLDNDKNFVKNDFQPNSDTYYIELMLKNCETFHKKITIDTPELIEKIEQAMWLRGAPGMADVDSSLLIFCNEIKKDVDVVFSGECADEIFAGYPWFFRDDSLNSNTFPWSVAIEERQNILNEDISKILNLKEYIDYRYKESIKKVDIINTDSKETADKRKISYLTMNWFMQTLLDRADKMSLFSGLEIRVPFCDYRIVEYLWNIPWEIKALNNREKGLLRYAVKDLLPDEIINRKKSPYPKTHNPTYTRAVSEKLLKIVQDKMAPINQIINKKYVLEIIETRGQSFKKPWFGQLMTGPQLMAYLIQINMWLEHYEPNIEI